MTLTDTEIDDVRKNGIGSHFVNKIEEMKKKSNILERFENHIIAESVDRIYEKHFHGENPISPFISISTHKDIAIAVGKHFWKSTQKWKKFYLLKKWLHC